MAGTDAAEGAPPAAASIANGWQYVPGYLAPDVARDLLRGLLARPIWQEERIVLFGRERRVPRRVAWFGDEGVCYRYSGLPHRAGGWLPGLRRIRDELARETGLAFNFLLLNRYRDGRDCMGWHRDDEAMVSHRIASLSLGAERRFLLRPVPGEPSLRLDLAHGSLLIMDGRIPHALPRTRRAVGERVNLSFRVLP